MNTGITTKPENSFANQTDNSRIEWVDISKGIVIVLMVVGHTSIPQPFSNYIWSYHMPFFFLISGMLFKCNKYKDFFYFSKTRIQSLIIPYIIMSLIVFAALFLIDKAKTNEILYGWEGYPLWFIPVLFLVELMAYYPIKYGRKRYYILLLITYLIGFALFLQGVHFPYKIEVVFMAFTYYIIGYLLKEKLLSVKPNVVMSIVLLVLSVVLSQLFPRLDMCFNDYGSFFNIIPAMVGSLSVIYISLIVCEPHSMVAQLIHSFFHWAGRNTIIIMGFASIIIILFNYIFEFIVINKMISSVGKHIILWILLYLISVIINNYAPIMAGKRIIN